MTFEEWYKESTKTNNRVFTAQEFYESGAASRQVEIDELIAKKEFRDLSQDLAIKNIKDGYEKQVAGLAKSINRLGDEIDELQKKLDYSENAYKDVKLNFLNEEDDLSALKKRIYNTLSAACDSKCNHAIIDILKGDKND